MIGGDVLASDVGGCAFLSSCFMPCRVCNAEATVALPCLSKKWAARRDAIAQEKGISAEDLEVCSKVMLPVGVSASEHPQDLLRTAKKDDQPDPSHPVVHDYASRKTKLTI